MKHTILGFKQIDLIKLGITLDETLILEHFVRFVGSGKVEEYYDEYEDKTYYWVYHKKVIDDLPILNITSTRSVSRKFEKLEEKGLLKSKVIKTYGGTKTYYRATELVPNLYSTEGEIDFKEMKEYKETNNKIPYQEILDYLNEKANKSFRNVQGHQRHIRARFKEGYELEDFKKVIDIKVSHWLNDEKYNQYLRPETLFGSKFDDYLNQEPKETEEIVEEIGKVW